MRARDAWLRQGALLASACALMLAVGLAASAAAPRPVTLEVDQAVGPGTCTAKTLGGSRAGNAALAADCDALLAARDTLAGEGALNWSAGTSLAEWDGVTVAGEPPRVVGLDLHARGLSGVIPTQLGSLTALASLDLSDNSLSGSLPAGLRDMPPTLATLRLAGNSFTGCLDERLRLATTNDLMTLEARGLPWCPVAEAPSEQPLAAGTYHIDNELIIDVPGNGPQVKLFAIIIASASFGGIYHCISDVNEQQNVCFSAHTAEEGVRGPARRSDRPGASGECCFVPDGLDEVFDKIAATARTVP